MNKVGLQPMMDSGAISPEEPLEERSSEPPVHEPTLLSDIKREVSNIKFWKKEVRECQDHSTNLKRKQLDMLVEFSTNARNLAQAEKNLAEASSRLIRNKDIYIKQRLRNNHKEV